MKFFLTQENFWKKINITLRPKGARNSALFYAYFSKSLRLSTRNSIERGDSMGDVQQGEVFIKFYAGARNGLVAALGSELFTTYAVLATYMDREGRCYPSQQLLAANLGISRETVNRRIKRLLAFEWKGEKLIENTEKHRDEKTQQWGNTIYKLNTALAFRIFT